MGRKNSTMGRNDINSVVEGYFVSFPNRTVPFFSTFPYIVHTFLYMCYACILLLHVYTFAAYSI